MKLNYLPLTSLQVMARQEAVQLMREKYELTFEEIGQLFKIAPQMCHRLYNTVSNKGRYLTKKLNQ